MKKFPPWVNDPEYVFIPGVGIHSFKGVYNWAYIRSKVWFWLLVFIGIPILAGLAIAVLQWVFPWWPR